MESKTETFSPDLTKYDTKIISVQSLDSLIVNFLDTTSKLQMIFLGLKLAIFFAWYFVRKSLIDVQLAKEKQAYEIAHHNADNDDVNT